MSYKIDLQNIHDPSTTNFGTQLMRLYGKGDLANRALFRKGFPNAAMVYEAYMQHGNIEDAPDLPYDTDVNPSFDLTKPGTYYFSIGIHGYGQNAKDAWDSAVAGFIEDPGDMDPAEIIDYDVEH